MPRDAPVDWVDGANSLACVRLMQRSCRFTRAAATITRSCASACRNWHHGSKRKSSAVANASVPRNHRFGAGARGRTRPQGGSRLARQAHAAAVARGGLDVLPRRDLLTDLPLPVDAPTGDHCGSCARCIDVCPTRAIVAPYQLDARRCISYLTIEHAGLDPERAAAADRQPHLRLRRLPARLPWNKFAQRARVPDFDVRNGLDCATLVELFAWNEARVQRAPSRARAIRRIGHERWLRNIAVALGNAPTSPAVIAALRCAAPIIQARWCASTWHGRWRSMAHTR